MKLRKFFPYLFFFSLVINVIVAAFFIRKNIINSNINVTNQRKPFSGKKDINTKKHYCEKNKMFKALETNPEDIIFSGDSFIDNFKITELTGDPKIKNRGIQGEFTAGLLDITPILLENSPSEIFIYIGINDIIFDIDINETKVNLKRIVNLLCKQRKGIQLHFISILPIRKNSEYCIDCNEEIIELNAFIKDLCLDNKVEFIDIHDTFYANNGLEIDAIYTINDGLHLNQEGYNHFYDLLAPYLK